MTDSTFMMCMEAVQTVIQDLNLTGLNDNRVCVRRKPHDGKRFHHGVSIHPGDERYDQGTNEREAIGYGCVVTMAVNNDNEQLALLDRLLYWRQQIRRKFVEDGSLGSVTGVYSVKVEHGRVIDWTDLEDKNTDVTVLVIRVYVLETRT